MQKINPKPAYIRMYSSSIHRFRYILIFIACAHCFGVAAQNPFISLSVKNVTLDVVLKEIKRQSGKEMVYNNNLIDKYGNETFEFKNLRVEDALKIVLEKKSLGYSIVDGIIVIEPKPESKGSETARTLFQNIKGNVFDIESNSPLIGANVVIMDLNHKPGSSTDADGNFKMEKVPVGRYNIQVSYMGYETKIVSEVLVTSSKEVVLNTGLKQALTQMNEVLVTVSKDKPLNTMASVSARSFTVEETRRYAGGMDDPARMASAFAGVAVGNIQNNGIIIRGNAPRGLSWRLEGIDIPNPNHLSGLVEGGGVVTVFSSQLLANSDFYTGAFPSEYGNALSGVFDMKLRNGDNEKYEQTFQIGLMGIDYATEGPISKQNGSSFLINYRYSTIGLIKDLGLLTTNETPNYQDLSFKLNFPTKKTGIFSLWGIGGVDQDLGSEETDSSKWESSYNRLKFTIKQKMGAMGLSHKYIMGNQTYFHTTVAVSGVQNQQEFTRLDDHLVRLPYAFFTDNSVKVTFSFLFNHKFNPRNTMRAGVNFHTLGYKVKINGTLTDNSPETYQNFVNENGNSKISEFYLQHKYEISEKLNVTGGVHINYLSLNGNYSIEPRGAVEWQFASNQSLSFGYGKHSQMEDLRIYLLKVPLNGNDYFPNKNLGFAMADHYVLSYNRKINNNVRLKIEPYFQYLYNVPGIKDSSYSMLNFSQDLTFHNVLVNNSRGRNIGIDFTLERFLKDNFYYMATFSVFSSRYRAGDGIWRDTRFNKGYVLNLLFGKEFFTKKNNLLGINGRLNFLGGDHYSPFNADQLNRTVVYNEYRAFQNQYAGTYYLDLTITYRINKAKYSGVWGFQVKNILGTPARIGFYYNYKTGKVEENNIVFILPVLSYKIEF